MTQNSTISLTFCVVVFALSLSAQTSNRQGTPAPPLFGAIPQMTQVQQENFPPQLLDQLSAIKAAALDDDYAYRQLAHLTENIGPRPTGSTQAKAAVDYVASQLHQLGLEVQLEEVKVPTWFAGLKPRDPTASPARLPAPPKKFG